MKVKIVRKFVEDKSNETILCYCKNCQRAEGGLSSFDLILLEDKDVLFDEKCSLKKYDDTDTKSKSVTKHYFCGQCGRPIISKNRESTSKKQLLSN